MSLVFMAFFTHITLPHFVNFSLTLPLCYSINFSKKLYNERKEDLFTYMACFSVSRYIKGGKKAHLETQLNFETHMLYKQPTLPKLCNYNIYVQMLYSYFSYTGRPFLGCALLVVCFNIVWTSSEAEKK